MSCQVKNIFLQFASCLFLYVRISRVTQRKKSQPCIYFCGHTARYPLQYLSSKQHKKFVTGIFDLLFFWPENHKEQNLSYGGKKKCIHTLPWIGRSSFTAHLTLNSRVQIATSALLQLYVLPSVLHQQHYPLHSISSCVFLSRPKWPCENW